MSRKASTRGVSATRVAGISPAAMRQKRQLLTARRASPAPRMGRASRFSRCVDATTPGDRAIAAGRLGPAFASRLAVHERPGLVCAPMAKAEPKRFQPDHPPGKDFLRLVWKAPLFALP